MFDKPSKVIYVKCALKIT